MSYEIVYERQFLKVLLPNSSATRIIPLCLHGSNNCTEYSNSGRERRARDWSAMYFNGGNHIPLETPEGIMSKIESYCGGEYQEHFKRNGKYVDDIGLRRFFSNGIKEAKTIEELNEISMSNIELHCYLSVWAGSENTIELRRYVKSSQELLTFISEAKARIDQRGKEQVYVQIGFLGDKAIPYPRVEAVQRVPKVYEDNYWVLESLRHGSNIFVSKLTARRLSYCQGHLSARKFGSEKEALNWVNSKIKDRFIGVAETLKPKCIELQRLQ